MGGVQVHDRPFLRALLVHGEMQEGFLGGLVAGKQPSLPVQFGDARRIQPPQGGVGGRDQDAVLQAHGDVARGPAAIAALKERLSMQCDALAQLALAGHASPPGARRKAFSKKSSVPKLPDLRASSSAGSPRLAVQGTPGSISRPILSALMPSAFSTAPEVSPPAMTRRRTPASTSARPMAAMVSSTRAPAASRPSSACTAATLSGAAVA